MVSLQNRLLFPAFSELPQADEIDANYYQETAQGECRKGLAGTGIGARLDLHQAQLAGRPCWLQLALQQQYVHVCATPGTLWRATGKGGCACSLQGGVFSVHGMPHA